jgi:hypothetical protein
MKAIQPVTIWVNGQQVTANQPNLSICNDNLIDSATFYYELIEQVSSEEGIVNTTLVTGNSSLQGAEYDSWNNSADINNDAYTLIAAKLNITLL